MHVTTSNPEPLTAAELADLSEGATVVDEWGHTWERLPGDRWARSVDGDDVTVSGQVLAQLFPTMPKVEAD